jgi:hypothetical protein
VAAAAAVVVACLFMSVSIADCEQFIYFIFTMLAPAAAA